MDYLTKHGRKLGVGLCIVTAAFVFYVLSSLMAPAAQAQTTVNAPNPSVTVGGVDANSASRADQEVNGIDAQLTTIFEASDIPSSTRARIKNVPDVIAPSIVGGNPCMVSASLGVSAVGIGVGGGVGVEDYGCETRQVAALIANMGDRAAAYMHMCMQNDEFHETVTALGFTSCADYAGVIQNDKARITNVAANSNAAPVNMNAARVIQQHRVTEPVSMSVATCSEQQYSALRRGDAAWSEWPASCKVMHQRRTGG